MAQKSSYEFVRYLAQQKTNGENGLPSLNDLSRELGISVASLREQLEVAKALGLVEVRPRTGMKTLPYQFTPAVQESLSYALEISPTFFDKFSDLRQHIESAYFHEAVALLIEEDKQELTSLIQRAWDKLRGHPIQIPQAEHRQLHTSLYQRLENPFVSGLLEAYWDAYEQVGLNLYADYTYLQQVWLYHEKIVMNIISGDIQSAYQALLEHTRLIATRPG